MKKLILSALILAASPWVLATGDVDAGKAKSATCAACHGADGNSPAGAFPSLAGQHVNYTIKQLKDMKVAKEQGGRPVAEMAAFVPGLSDQDIADLAAFYAAQKPKGNSTKAELLEKGESVYRSGNLAKGVAACTGCHSPDGKGNKGAAYPLLAGQHADYIEKQLRAFRTGAEEPNAGNARINDGDTRIMRDIAANMSDLEIRAVASFIAGLR